MTLAHRKEAPLPPAFRWRRDLLPALYVINIFALIGIFFRASSFSQAGSYFAGIFGLRSGGLDANFVVVLILAVLVVAAIDITQRNSRDETAVIHWSAPARAVVYGTFILAIVVFSGGTTTPFIYFQF